MTVRLATVATRADSASRNASPHLTCAFVNNMPDGAFDATERQYLDLLNEVSGSELVEVRRYAMNGVPRGVHTSSRIDEEYFPPSDIYGEPPDLLIVTGSNPIESDIENELYWTDLVELISWAGDYVDSTLLSCLAAHAALTIFDGLVRNRLAVKCTGVFPQQVEPNHPLTAGLETQILLPHSRWNSVPREELERAGYDVVIHSESTGWGVAARETGGHKLLLVQGHPEYDPSSLLREYRRDAGRFVRGEQSDLPILPLHCVSPDDWESLEWLHLHIADLREDPTLFDEFPFDDVGARAPWTWREVAKALYSNWLSNVDHGR